MKKVRNNKFPITAELLNETSKKTGITSFRIRFYDRTQKKYLYELTKRLSFKAYPFPAEKRNKAFLDAEIERTKAQAWVNEHGYQAPEIKKEANFITYFMEVMATKQDGTKGVYNSKLGQFQNFLESIGRNREELLFKEVNDMLLERFRLYVLSNYKQNTAAASLALVLAVANKAYKARLIDRKIQVGWIKHVRSMKQYLTFEEFKILLATPSRDEDVKRAFILAFYSGLRVSDWKKLTWDDIVYVKGQWKVNIIMKKTKEPLYNTVKPEIIKLLGKRGGADQKVFREMSPNTHTINRILQGWVKKAGINKYITSQCGRVSFGTRIVYKKGLFLAQRALGHADYQTTALSYAHLVDKELDEATSFEDEIIETS